MCYGAMLKLDQEACLQRERPGNFQFNRNPASRTTLLSAVTRSVLPQMRLFRVQQTDNNTSVSPAASSTLGNGGTNPSNTVRNY